MKAFVAAVVSFAVVMTAAPTIAAATTKVQPTTIAAATFMQPAAEPMPEVKPAIVEKTIAIPPTTTPEVRAALIPRPLAQTRHSKPTPEVKPAFKKQPL